MTVIEFWFDFSSPYAYFAAFEVEPLAARHGRTIAYRPFALGALFRETGLAPLTEQPLRGDYARRDWDRLARLMKRPFRLPSPFPVRTLSAARACHLANALTPQLVGAFVRTCFTAVFERGDDLENPDVLRECLQAAGLPVDLMDRLTDDVVKDGFRLQSEEARRKGVFGAPFFIVDGEPFWGADRLPMLDLWLERGGW